MIKIADHLFIISNLKYNRLLSGAPCSRLPCDLRCEKTLECGHRCPGVCGENCPTSKFCEICAPDDVKEQSQYILYFYKYCDFMILSYFNILSII